MGRWPACCQFKISVTDNDDDDVEEIKVNARGEWGEK